jgi:hypothetical protein
MKAILKFAVENKDMNVVFKQTIHPYRGKEKEDRV